MHTRLPGFTQKLTKIGIVILFFFFLSLSFLVGMSYQKTFSSTANEITLSPSPSSKLSYQPKTEVISISDDQKSQLILRTREDEDFDLILKQGGTEKIIDEVTMYIRKVIWSPDNSAIAFSSGGQSAGYTVKVINLVTGQKIPT